jgi:hypothetical protein
LGPVWDVGDINVGSMTDIELGTAGRRTAGEGSSFRILLRDIITLVVSLVREGLVLVAHDDEKMRWVQGEGGGGSRGSEQTQQKKRKGAKSQSAVLIRIFPLHLSETCPPSYFGHSASLLSSVRPLSPIRHRVPPLSSPSNLRGVHNLAVLLDSGAARSLAATHRHNSCASL